MSCRPGFRVRYYNLAESKYSQSLQEQMIYCFYLHPTVCWPSAKDRVMIRVRWQSCRIWACWACTKAQQDFLKFEM